MSFFRTIFLFFRDVAISLLVVFLFVIVFELTIHRIYLGILLGSIAGYITFRILRGMHSDSSYSVRDTVSRKPNKLRQVHDYSTELQDEKRKLITNVVVKNSNACQIYGVDEHSSERMNKLLGTGPIKGKLLGWSSDFYVTGENGWVWTYDVKGQRVGHFQYNPTYYHFGGVGVDSFSIVSNKNNNVFKLYDRKCKLIH